MNLDFLGTPPWFLNVFRVVVLLSVGFGAVIALEAVWSLADVAMGLMALVNLVAILALGRWAFAALADYEALRAGGREPVFAAAGNPRLPEPLTTDVW